MGEALSREQTREPQTRHEHRHAPRLSSHMFSQQSSGRSVDEVEGIWSSVSLG